MFICTHTQCLSSITDRPVFQRAAWHEQFASLAFNGTHLSLITQNTQKKLWNLFLMPKINTHSRKHTRKVTRIHNRSNIDVNQTNPKKKQFAESFCTPPPLTGAESVWQVAFVVLSTRILPTVCGSHRNQINRRKRTVVYMEHCTICKIVLQPG